MIRNLLLILIVLALSCGDGKQVYKVVGTVRSIKLDEQKAIIAHDTIPNLMMPMIMPFFIPDLKELDKIEIGDSVHFEFIWNDTKPFPEILPLSAEGIYQIMTIFLMMSFLKKVLALQSMMFHF